MSGIDEALHQLGPLLELWGGPAAVVGGVGIVARVRPRYTEDVDVLVAVPVGRGGELLALARSLGWEDDPDETRLLLDGGLLHLRRGADGHVDLIFVDSTFLDDVVRRATPIDLGVVTLPVATTEDLLLLKLEAHRTEDLDDILAIKDACAEQLDMTYVRAQAGRLGLLERLELYFGR